MCMGKGKVCFYFHTNIFHLTLKVPIMTAVDNIHKYFFIVFHRK